MNQRLDEMPSEFPDRISPVSIANTAFTCSLPSRGRLILNSWSISQLHGFPTGDLLTCSHIKDGTQVLRSFSNNENMSQITDKGLTCLRQGEKKS